MKGIQWSCKIQNHKTPDKERAIKRHKNENPDIFIYYFALGYTSIHINVIAAEKY